MPLKSYRTEASLGRPKESHCVTRERVALFPQVIDLERMRADRLEPRWFGWNQAAATEPG